MKHLSTMFFVLLFPLCVMAQEVFEWENPSFEKNRRAAAQCPYGWTTLTNEGAYASGDIQPGFFGCVTQPFAGENYLGLVMRDNGTFEGVYQTFKQPFVKDSFYTFSVWAARSDEYNSITIASPDKQVKFNAPATLAVLGITKDKPAEFEFLAQSLPVKSTDWQRIDFTFKPRKKNYYSIALAVLPEENDLPFKNGNVLIDNVSQIVHLPFNTFSDSTLNVQKIANKIYFSQSDYIPIIDHGFAEKRIYSEWVFYSFSGDHLKSSSDSFYVDRVNQGLKDGIPLIENKRIYLTTSRYNAHYGIGQSLVHPVNSNTSYQVRVTLSSRETKITDGHLVLKVWGGTPDKPRQELLDQTQAINHKRSKSYLLQMNPLKNNWEFIFFEATVADESKPYNGNLTIHYISDLIRLK